jgi:serine/threonine protein kinase
MVLFEFLNGSLPDRDEHPFKMVKVGVSPEAADFVNQLLRIDPMQRMNVASMFTHPWFTKMASAE